MDNTTSLGVFPLVRKLSQPIVVLISRFPITPNQITMLSLIAGVGAAACFVQNDYQVRLIGAVLFVFCYLLDNCDGEIARLKHLNSEFGDFFDTFVDWIVHTTLFLALGYGNYQLNGDLVWLWFGFFAGAGASINYFLGLFIKDKDNQLPECEQASLHPNGNDLFVLIFRELTRADFCFILLILTLLDSEWLLLPAAAIGAQVYWLTQFMEGARKFHV